MTLQVHRKKTIVLSIATLAQQSSFAQQSFTPVFLTLQTLDVFGLTSKFTAIRTVRCRMHTENPCTPIQTILQAFPNVFCLGLD